MQRDKKLHMIVGFIISLSAIFIPAMWALFAVIVIGAFKEIYDKLSGKGTPEVLDFVATVAGGLPVIMAYLMM
jgi:hypothetical protein